MRIRIRRKWRPTLAQVLAATLAAVLLAPLAGLSLVALLVETLGPVWAHAASALVVVGTTLALGAVLRRLLLGPVRALAARAEDAKNPGPAPLSPLARYGTRELERLGQSVLDMAGTLRAREAGIRTYTDHASHELKSPLTSIRGAAELLAGGAGRDDARREKLVGSILTSADRMEKLLAGMRRVAAARESMAEGSCRLSEVLGEVDLGKDGPAVDLEGVDTVLPIHRDGLEIVLRQTLSNAAAHGARRVRISAGEDGTSPFLRISDDGSGISDGNRGRVFEPFFTTRRDDGGTGLGLAIIRAVLGSIGASVALEDAPEGATFLIRF